VGSNPTLSASLFDCTCSESCGFFVSEREDELARPDVEKQKKKTAEGRLQVQSKRLKPPTQGSAKSIPPSPLSLAIALATAGFYLPTQAFRDIFLYFV
jgi:hypothetical protein